MSARNLSQRPALFFGPLLLALGIALALSNDGPLPGLMTLIGFLVTGFGLHRLGRDGFA